MESFEILSDDHKATLAGYANGYIRSMPHDTLRLLVMKCLEALEEAERKAIELSLAKQSMTPYPKHLLIQSYGDMVFYDNMDEAIVGHAVQANGRHVAVYDWNIMYDLCKEKKRGDIMDLMKMFLDMHKGESSPVVLFR